LIVPEGIATDELADEEVPLLDELELELELLEPHAAIPSDAATSRPTALMRLVLKVISLINYVCEVCAESLWI
jgi:hypothetical protein